MKRELILILVLGAISPLVPRFISYFLATTYVLAIFVMSLDLALGYTGIWSFGHAMFFGLGAYSFGLSLPMFGMNLFLSLIFTLGMGSIFSFLTGLIVVRARGAGVAIVTFVLGFIFYTTGLAMSWLTGGEDGVTFPRPELLPGITLLEQHTMYYFSLCSFLSCFFLLRRIVRSPVGKIFQAIRDNEQRASSLGYNTSLYRFLSYAISGTIASLSGGLYAAIIGSANMTFASFEYSLYAVALVLIGGPSSLIGPVLSTLSFEALGEVLSAYHQIYLILVGASMVLTVFFAPRGVFIHLITVWRKLHAGG